jgi:hypothetical protein
MVLIGGLYAPHPDATIKSLVEDDHGVSVTRKDGNKAVRAWRERD